MGLDTAIARWRRKHQALFSSECSITREATEGAFDPNTGAIGAGTSTTVYEGLCLVREMTWEGSDVVTGDRQLRMQRAELRLPHDTAIREDDIVTVTVSKRDSGLVGQVFRITDVFLDDLQVVRRAIMAKVTGGPS